MSRLAINTDAMCLGWVQTGGGELAEALAWLQAHGADTDGSDAEGDGGGALSALAAQVASLPPGARSSQQVCNPGRRPICFRALSDQSVPGSNATLRPWQERVEGDMVTGTPCIQMQADLPVDMQRDS